MVLPDRGLSLYADVVGIAELLVVAVKNLVDKWPGRPVAAATAPR
jgi:hypothetical protein